MVSSGMTRLVISLALVALTGGLSPILSLLKHPNSALPGGHYPDESEFCWFNCIEPTHNLPQSTSWWYCHLLNQASRGCNPLGLQLRCDLSQMPVRVAQKEGMSMLARIWPNLPGNLLDTWLARQHYRLELSRCLCKLHSVTEADQLHA